MSTHRLTTLDVFTDRPLTGNQLAVVHDADAVPDSVQQAFAVETKLSETTFVQTPTVDGPSYRNRIYCTTHEMDFAGHPSLGTAVAVAAAEGDASIAYVQETPAGQQPIQVSRDGDVWHAEMLIDAPTFGEPLDTAPLLRAVGLDAGDAHPTLPAVLGSCGNPVVLLPLVDTGALAQARGDHTAMTEALHAFGSDLIYAFVPGDDRVVRARAIFLDLGFSGEDPATGSAAAPLMGHLAAHTGAEAITVHQGVEMGRPSILRCAMADNGIRLAGDVVVISVGEVRLPAV